MKNRFYVFLLAAFTFCATSLFAREPEVNIVSKGDNKLLMELFTHEASAVIRILDANGYLLFSEKTGETPQYSMVFDMAPLPEGSYRFEVEGENTIQVIDFQVRKSKLTLIGDAGTYFKPVISQKGKQADLQLLNIANQPVIVTFRDAGGQLLMRHAQEPDVKIEQRFNLAQLSPGLYSMTVQVGDKLYQKKLVIK